MRDEQQGDGPAALTAPDGGSRALARWRIAAAAGVLAVLGYFGVLLAPFYFRNLELQRYVDEITRRKENVEKSDDLLRTWVVEEAAGLDLPVKAHNVHIKRSPAGLRIDVRYVVRVDLPVYTVDLHFRPGAGVR
ncbi:MAG TPA: hypothetical protein VN442_23125 [Bryobacteraceae bacterium]|nr:hypothetical protein [Bryobacteraceae bacterium]